MGKLYLSPKKSTVVRSEPHQCISFTNEHLIIKEAKQELIDVVKNPVNVSKPVQSLYNAMEVSILLKL